VALALVVPWVFDQEGETDVRAPLLEIVAAQADRDDIDGLDVAKRLSRLGEP